MGLSQAQYANVEQPLPSIGQLYQFLSFHSWLNASWGAQAALRNQIEQIPVLNAQVELGLSTPFGHA